jgi:hypothetical protein
MSDLTDLEKTTVVEPPEDSRVRRGSMLTWLSLLLLIIAAGLYVGDVRASRARAAAANEIRGLAAQALSAVAIGTRLPGREVPILAHCPAPLASNLVIAIANAQPAKFPRGVVEGLEFELHLIGTNRQSRVIEAAILDHVPESVFVRSKRSTKNGEAEGKTREIRYWQPVRLDDVGVPVMQFMEMIENSAQKLPSDEEIMNAASNVMTSAAAGAATGAEGSAGAEEAVQVDGEATE